MNTTSDSRPALRRFGKARF